MGFTRTKLQNVENIMARGRLRTLREGVFSRAARGVAKGKLVRDGFLPGMGTRAAMNVLGWNNSSGSRNQGQPQAQTQPQYVQPQAAPSPYDSQDQRPGFWKRNVFDRAGSAETIKHLDKLKTARRSGEETGAINHNIMRGAQHTADIAGLEHGTAANKSALADAEAKRGRLNVRSNSNADMSYAQSDALKARTARRGRLNNVAATPGAPSPQTANLGGGNLSPVIPNASSSSPVAVPVSSAPSAVPTATPSASNPAAPPKQAGPGVWGQLRSKLASAFKGQNNAKPVPLPTITPAAPAANPITPATPSVAPVTSKPTPTFNLARAAQGLKAKPTVAPTPAASSVPPITASPVSQPPGQVPPTPITQGNATGLPAGFPTPKKPRRVRESKVRATGAAIKAPAAQGLPAPYNPTDEIDPVTGKPKTW